jgi:hypothetical protein
MLGTGGTSPSAPGVAFSGTGTRLVLLAVADRLAREGYWYCVIWRAPRVGVMVGDGAGTVSVGGDVGQVSEVRLDAAGWM